MDFNFSKKDVIKKRKEKKNHNDWKESEKKNHNNTYIIN